MDTIFSYLPVYNLKNPYYRNKIMVFELMTKRHTKKSQTRRPLFTPSSWNRNPKKENSDENTYQRLLTPDSVRSWRTLIQRSWKEESWMLTHRIKIWSLENWGLESFCLKTVNFWFIHPVIEICSISCSIGAAQHGRKFKIWRTSDLKTTDMLTSLALIHINDTNLFLEGVDTVYWTTRIN